MSDKQRELDLLLSLPKLSPSVPPLQRTSKGTRPPSPPSLGLLVRVLDFSPVGARGFGRAVRLQHKMAILALVGLSVLHVLARLAVHWTRRIYPNRDRPVKYELMDEALILPDV